MTNLSLARVLSGGMTAVHPDIHARDRARECDDEMIDRWDGGWGRKHHFGACALQPAWHTPCMRRRLRRKCSELP